METQVAEDATRVDENVIERDHSADDATIGVFFEDEKMPTDEELMGSDSEESPGEKDTDTQPKGDEEDASEKETKPEDTKTEDEGKPKEDEGKPKEDEGKPEESKPPTGFVSHGALLEERRRRQALQEENSQLEERIAAMERGKAPPREEEPPAEEPGLTKKALSGFMEKLKGVDSIDPSEDPVGASTAALNLLKEVPALMESMVKEGEEKEQTQQEAEQEQAAFEDAIAKGQRSLAALVPLIQEKEYNLELAKVLMDSGLPRDLLAEITHPGTLIMSPDGSPRYLGEDVGYIVTAFNNLYQKGKGGAVDLESLPVADIVSKRGDEIRKEIEPALRKEIEKDVTTEILAKLKKDGKIREGDDSEFVPLSEVPGEAPNDDGFDPSRHLSDAEFAKLNAEQRNRYLMGGDIGP
jgi:hypothetical protein